MVQFSTFLTVMLAGSSIASASDNVRAAAGASAQSEARDAVASVQNLLTVLSNSIGSERQLDGAELKNAFEGYVRMLQGVANINQLPPGPAGAANASAGFVPNWEGAALGGLAMGIHGLFGGAMIGMTTTWSFAGLNSAIKSMTGIDPMELLAGGGAAASPSAPKPASAPAPKGVSSPSAPKPPGIPPAPVTPPKPVTNPVVNLPTQPKIPANPVVPPAAAAPPAGAAPAGAAPMPGMGGMGHSHGGRK